MAAVICGSLAFDTIMTFEGRFAEQILPDQLHILNVSFLVPALRATSAAAPATSPMRLKLLGGTPLPMGAVGSDGGDYLQRFEQLGIATGFVLRVDDTYTAQAMIMTDRDNNQITAFHPGAMMQAHRMQVQPRDDIKLGMVSPDGRDAMLQHAQQFKAAGIPFVFDPGPGPADVRRPGARELHRPGDLGHRQRLRRQDAVRAHRLEQRRDLAPGAGLVVTLGGDGCEVWVNGEVTLVPPEQAKAIVDPTGCGDAWRGALLYGLEQGWSLTRCAQLGNKVGALKIASRGPQNYTLAGLKH
jgi:adenosine kinase